MPFSISVLYYIFHSSKFSNPTFSFLDIFLLLKLSHIFGAFFLVLKYILLFKPAFDSVPSLPGFFGFGFFGFQSHYGALTGHIWPRFLYPFVLRLGKRYILCPDPICKTVLKSLLLIIFLKTWNVFLLYVPEHYILAKQLIPRWQTPMDTDFQSRRCWCHWLTIDQPTKPG